MMVGRNEAVDISKNEKLMNSLKDAFNCFLNLIASAENMDDPTYFFGIDFSRAHYGFVTVIYDARPGERCFTVRYRVCVESEEDFVARFKALLFDIMDIVSDDFS